MHYQTSTTQPTKMTLMMTLTVHQDTNVNKDNDLKHDIEYHVVMTMTQIFGVKSRISKVFHFLEV